MRIEELVLALEQEFEKLRRDAAERAQEAGRGAALIGSAGALGLVSAAALGSLPLLAQGVARLAAVSPKALEQEIKGAVGDVAGAVR